MRNPFIVDEPTCISFSGGRTSAYMLWRILQANKGLPKEAVVCFANTGKEDEATLKFVKDCQDNWDVEIHWLEYSSKDPKFTKVDYDSASRNGEPFADLIVKRNYLPNPVARFCTSELKILTIDRFLKSIGFDEYQTAIGIRADEQRRAAKMTDKYIPLVRAGITQQDVQNFWRSNTFDLQLSFNNGITPLGNCDLCFLKGNHQIMSMIADKPERAVWWANMENIIKATFRKDRPSYFEMKKYAGQQIDMLDSESIDCFCGD